MIFDPSISLKRYFQSSFVNYALSFTWKYWPKQTLKNLNKLKYCRIKAQCDEPHKIIYKERSLVSVWSVDGKIIRYQGLVI